VVRGDLVHELREPERNAGVLERRLDVLELVLGAGNLGVAAEQPRQEVLAGAASPEADLEQGRLKGLVVAEAAPPERLLDRRVEVVRLVLRDLPGTVPKDARQLKDRALADPGAEQQRDGLDRFEVLLSDPLLARRARQTERDEEALQGLERDPISFASCSNVRSERGGLRPALSRYPSVSSPVAIAAASAPASMPLRSRSATTRARMTSRRANPAPSRARIPKPTSSRIRSTVVPARSATSSSLSPSRSIELRLGRVRARIGDERIVTGLRTKVVRCSSVLGRCRGIIAVDPHPAHGIGHHRHHRPPPIM
jgi:hypothetical protein